MGALIKKLKKKKLWVEFVLLNIQVNSFSVMMGWSHCSWVSTESHHEKTRFLHVRKQRRRSASQKTAKLISAFVFTIRIVQFLFFQNPKFQASNNLL